ncbi:MAG TPA: 3-hydroxyacyl-CoA dehydrogenase NAD-binding domain-containing protein, partial [Candidatus Binatia bacterium]|nr:3-hydroxyacyl-CoA dehydrogenase NAD-binding domain-containing protein [Candidatus Binatia bacterium]
ETDRVRKGLLPAAALADLADADLVTEAVSESAETKRAVYGALRAARFGGILTTNTSSLTRASLIGGGEYPDEKFATTHFFNPVLHTEMVEIVKGGITPASYAVLAGFLSDLGRRPVETRDISGFVSNSVLMVYAVMALRLVESGATIEAVDGAARELPALPPLFSFDNWKPSIVEDVTRVMFESRGDRFLRSSKLLAALAEDNPRFYVDQKPNEAIYRLTEPRGDTSGTATIKIALQTSVRVAAARVVELGESPATVDLISTEGLKFTRGPLAEIDEIGATAVLKDLEELNATLPGGKLEAPAILCAMAAAGETFFKSAQPNPAITKYVEGKIDARH